jgi:adenosylhomocysteine nucleosidase
VNKLRRALVLAPMTNELRPIVKYARAKRTRVDGLTAYTGRAGDVEVVVVQAGVGPASSRKVTERALECFPVDHVLVSGIAGGLHPDLSIGTVVVPEEVLDLASGERYTSSPMDGVQRRGLIATADHLIMDEQQLADIAGMGVVAMEMESSGVAAACLGAGVPWTTFRVISDRPDDGLTDDAIMSLLRPDGSADVAAALRLMLRHPGRIPGMVRLGRDSSMATAKAARASLGALGWSR